MPAQVVFILNDLADFSSDQLKISVLTYSSCRPIFGEVDKDTCTLLQLIAAHNMASFTQILTLIVSLKFRDFTKLTPILHVPFVYISQI